jgi:hypothetical protein
MSECPICFEEDPDTMTDCCKQRICKLCLEQCKKSCPFCRTVTVEIEKEVPVTHAGRYERCCFAFCLVFCVIFIIGVCIGMAFSILKTKEILAARRDFLDKNKTLVYTNDHTT